MEDEKLEKLVTCYNTGRDIGRQMEVLHESTKRASPDWGASDAIRDALMLRDTVTSAIRCGANLETEKDSIDSIIQDIAGHNFDAAKTEIRRLDRVLHK